MSSNTLTTGQEPGGASVGFEGDTKDASLGGLVRGYLDKVRGGDLGALPAVLGIVVLGILFTVLRPNTFPTPLNLTNLLVQAVPITVLAMGLVFVLLLGEIDLAAGRWLLNPGSVGQPRDGDPRAAWLLLDLEAGSASFRRVEYEVASTQAQIREEGLPDALASRLAHGV